MIQFVSFRKDGYLYVVNLKTEQCEVWETLPSFLRNLVPSNLGGATIWKESKES